MSSNYRFFEQQKKKYCNFCQIFYNIAAYFNIDFYIKYWFKLVTYYISHVHTLKTLVETYFNLTILPSSQCITKENKTSKWMTNT